MKSSRWALVLAAGLFALSACGGSKSRLKVGMTDDGEVVEAEGLAPNNTSDPIATKRSSLADAQRKAVEKAVGVYVSARTLVDKAVAIEDNILSKTNGYVKKYDVLKEWVEDGMYKTRIRALVATGRLEEDLRQMDLMKTPALERPRVTVALSEQVDKSASDDGAAGSALEKALLETGFVVVTQDRAKDADLAVSGTASSYPFQAEGLGGFVSYRARLSVKVTRPGASDVLSSLTKEASGLGGSSDLAGLKALETVGELVGKELSVELPKTWARGRSLLVFVEGVSTFDQVEAIKRHLTSQPGVEDVFFRIFEEKMAQFELQLGSARVNELANGLQKSTSLPLTVLEVQPQLLRLQVP